MTSEGIENDMLDTLIYGMRRGVFIIESGGSSELPYWGTGTAQVLGHIWASENVLGTV